MKMNVLTEINGCNSLSDINKIITQDSCFTEMKTKNWSLYKILEHCTQTIEYSIIGYPTKKNLIVRNTIGKIVLRLFFIKNKMKHNLQAPVPGSPYIAEDGDVTQAINKLINTIDQFYRYEGQMKTHAFFGNISKNNYDKYFVMHIKDHFTELALN